MREVGNIRSNQLYNPDEVRNPPPTNMIDAERDSELEKFIRGWWRWLPCKSELTQALYQQTSTNSSASSLGTSSLGQVDLRLLPLILGLPARLHLSNLRHLPRHPRINCGPRHYHQLGPPFHPLPRRHLHLLVHRHFRQVRLHALR